MVINLKFFFRFSASGRWFMTMNYLVHTIMYSYYALKAMRFNVPKVVSQLITTGQIVQMIAGCYVNYAVWQIKHHSPKIECHNSEQNILYSSILYLTYFILFFNFFLNAYVIEKKNSTRLAISSTFYSSANKHQIDLTNNFDAKKYF
jgi:elongation of very long chain fatty acids protein 6